MHVVLLSKLLILNIFFLRSRLFEKRHKFCHDDQASKCDQASDLWQQLDVAAEL